MRKNDNTEEIDENCDFCGFFSAEEAWFWCCRCRMMCREGFGNKNNSKARNFETNDIYLIIKKLMLERRIGHRHIKILVRFGQEQSPPSLKYGDSCKECHLWRHAIQEMDKELRLRGIVK